MSLAYMTPVVDDNYVPKSGKTWEYTDTLSGAGNGDTVVIPPSVTDLFLALVIGTGNGKIQTTTSPLSTVEGGTCTWVDWASGAVAVTTREDSKRVAAVRQVNVSGTTVLEILGVGI